MVPPLSHPDCNEAHPGALSSGRPGNEDGKASSTMRAGAKISQYSHVSASDQARQHIGDVFHGPVTLQHIAPTSATATVPARGVGRNRLMESLVFKEMDARFIDVHPNLVGTCEWLPETPEYKRWLDPELMSTHHGFLWIKGKAGAGKSTLMKHASMHAEAHCSARQHVLNFFFHARGGSFEISTGGLFRSLLHQLLEKVPTVYDSLNKRRLRLVERQGWSSATLKDTFREAVLSLDQDQVTCYIDAMDECHEKDIDDIIQYFDHLGDALVADEKRFYVCLSSRHYPSLRASKSVEVVLDNQYGHDKDIRQYIRQRLMIDGKDLKRNLTKLIGSRAHGVFLWVVLVVALVNQDDRNGNAAQIYQRLDQIPTELSELFNELIGRGTHSEYFRPLLQWVAYSTRPLTPSELYCTLVYGALKTNRESLTLEEKNLAKFIICASKGLVEITTGRPRAQFIHESLRTYFLEEGLVHLLDQATTDFVPAESIELGVQEFAAMTARCHNQLKERCLGYLLQIDPFPSPSLSETRAEHSTRRLEIETSYPFLDYAVNGVMRHADTALDLGLSQQAFIDTLPCNELNIFRHITDKRYLQHVPTVTAPWYKAYMAAKFGCSRLLKAILETQPPFEASLQQWGVILCTSIDASDLEGVSIALQAGADPNAPSRTMAHTCLRYAIHLASAARFLNGRFEHRGWDVVELLLSHGARPYDTTDYMRYCTEDISNHTDVEYLRTLLGQHMEADAQCSDNSFLLALAGAVGRASRLGDDEMLQFLLVKGAVINLWSQVRNSTHADLESFLEVTFGHILLIRRVLAEVPRLSASSGITSNIIVTAGPSWVTLRFKQHISWAGSQS
jgi:hypothetical protein